VRYDTPCPGCAGAARLHLVRAARGSERAKATPDRVALKRKVAGKWEDITWKGYRDAARRVGLGLQKLGLERGQAVAILAETRAEWSFSDMGVLGVGGVTVPIYHSSTADEVKFILEDSGTRFVICENLDQWLKLKKHLADLKKVEKVFLIEGKDTEKTKAADAGAEGHPKVMSFASLMEAGDGVLAEKFDEACNQATPDDTVTFIYTSGTTGNPKGVILTHGNGVAECDALADALEILDDEVTVAFLPLAHVFARVLHWMQLKAGYTAAFAESIPKVVDTLGEIQPTFFAAVPRIYEKIHGNVMAGIQELPGWKRSWARWGLDGWIERDRLRRAGKTVPLGLSLRCGVGGPPVAKVKAKLGARVGQRLRYFISGGAPLSAEIAAFFATLGYPIYEGYGLTETTAATHVNKPGAHRIGTVGRAVKGLECKIAQDGEILVRGPIVMKGYHNNPAATAEVIDKDGWFATGDIGEIDQDGFLRITDRKKDLIVNAAGKNIAPQNVENHLKTDRFISQAALFGDKQRFCVALVTLKDDDVKKQLQAEGITPPATTKELAAHPRVKELLDASIAAKNKELPSYMQVKYFEILPKDFEVGEDGELTPSLKVKRKVVKKKYGDLVDRMYANAPAGKGGE
jgi:long-chain acyl-CoA synthetase